MTVAGMRRGMRTTFQPQKCSQRKIGVSTADSVSDGPTPWGGIDHWLPEHTEPHFWMDFDAKASMIGRSLRFDPQPKRGKGSYA